MNIKGIQKITQTIVGGVAKNSPTILTGLGVAGVVTTVVMGIKATPKALSILEDEVYKKYIDEIGINNTNDITFEDWINQQTGNNTFLSRMETLTTKNKVSATWKCYIPTVIMGALTIGCMIGANSINLRRNAALASLYSLSETTLKEYQAKVVEKIGESKHREIKEEIIKDRIKKDPYTDQDVVMGKGEVLCYDNMSGRYFYSNKEDIKAACNKISQTMMNDQFASLNELYSELDIEQTKTGDLVGWYIADGILEPCFGSQIAHDGTPCLVLDFYTEPRSLDRNY